ncbi:MAG: hypothetical protein ACFUZC_23615 [Chthoniobacteraceae bacterium]
MKNDSFSNGVKAGGIAMGWLRAALAGVCAVLLPLSHAAAFTAIKNVNDGHALVDKVVLFEKGKPADHLVFESTESCKTAISAEGAIESRIVGSDAVKVTIHWKPAGELTETLDATKYGYLLLTCRLEGCSKSTQPDGKVVEQRPDNLWIGPSLINDKGETVGGANMADVAADKKTPSQTVTLKFPMVLFTVWGKDVSRIQAIGFIWGKNRPTVSRDFRLVIDKISLAE